MEWSTACLDWKRRIVGRESLVPPPLFPSEAAAALEVFNELKIVDAAGQPRFGDVAEPFLSEFVSSIFGAYDEASGRRLIQEFFLLISKKNGKSTVAAGTMLTALIRNWRASAEFIILAPTVEVANNAFGPVRDMIKHDPELQAILHVQEHIKTVTHRLTGATLKVVAADSDTVGGKKAVGVFIDEVWLFGKQKNAEDIFREACGGLASRPEGFVIYATTQSNEPPAGVFAKKLRYARDVRDGVIEDRGFLPVLYEFPPEMIALGEHRKPENFYITNPNLGVSVDVAFLNRELAKAEAEGEVSLKGFLAKHLNVEIGLNLRNDRWPGADFWQRCAKKVLTLKELIERSEVITIGIDGGGLDDLLGLCVMGREKGTGQWLIWTCAFAHPIVLERRKEVAPALMDYAQDGDLTFVERVGQDVEAVVSICKQVFVSSKLDKIGVDIAGIGAIETGLKEAGIPEDQIVGISQGWKLNGAIKTMERKIAGQEVEHSGSRLMNWCVGNARVVPVGNAVTITKQASGTAKIDPLMALFNAATLMALDPEAKASIEDFLNDPIFI